MKYKKLGKSGIKVSEIGFGAWTIALNWWGKEIQEDEAKRMLKKAYDLGINFFETADMYGKGKSEKLIGDCLLYTSPSPRDQRGSRMPSSA